MICPAYLIVNPAQILLGTVPSDRITDGQGYPDLGRSESTPRRYFTFFEHYSMRSSPPVMFFMEAA